MSEEKRQTYPWGLTPGLELPTMAEHIASERKRRAEYEASPQFQQDEYFRRYREEKAAADKAARKAARSTKAGEPFVGPPNPYKPHRRWKLEE